MTAPVSVRVPRRIAAALAVLLLSGCAGAAGPRSDRLPDILNHARAFPEHRLADEVACTRSLTRGDDNFPFEAVFAGLFDVPEASATGAFCAALIDAVIVGDFSKADQDAFSVPSEVRGKAPLGKLLRAVVEAHERLSAQHAQLPPQALSCGCGQ
jgi:hypothetical protein